MSSRWQKIREVVENSSESTLFASRWLLAPVYLGLILGLVFIVIKFFMQLWELTLEVIPGGSHELILGLLGLLDLALLGNLILIVIFAGYENFVSKINAAENSEDRPHWMGQVDFSGLKIKLIGSLVAISVIELLQDFVHAGAATAEHQMDWTAEGWRIGLHGTFVISGVLFAVMDYIADKRKLVSDEHHARIALLHAQLKNESRDLHETLDEIVEVDQELGQKT